jgi:hypothetical protein
MKSDSTAIAQELSEWFQSVQRLTEASLFGIAPEGPHRAAVVLDVLRRNARLVFQSTVVPDGSLYSPLCFFLVAASRQLRTSLGIGHWRAALDDVHNEMQRLVASLPDSTLYGLDPGTAAQVYKRQFDEAIRQTGLIEGTSFLSKEDREVALALAVHWGLRLLLAYAAETPRPERPVSRKDLAWLADRVAVADLAQPPT